MLAGIHWNALSAIFNGTITEEKIYTNLTTNYTANFYSNMKKICLLAKQILYFVDISLLWL